MPGGRLNPLARELRDEVVAGHTTGAISRRDVLKLGGAFSASLALAACTRSTPPTPVETKPVGASAPTAHQARVVVVGAGLAGITAAYRLSQQGVRVQLFEARERLGGRCWTAHGFAQGQTAEHGGEFIDSRHVHIRGLAAELGLRLDDLFAGWPEGSESPNWIEGGYLDHVVTRRWHTRMAAAALADAHRIGEFATGRPTFRCYSYGSATKAAMALDAMSMSDWLHERFPDLPSVVESFWNVTMAGWYGLDLAALSAVNWVDFFVTPYPGADERWHVHGGNDQVPNLTADRLPAGTVTLEAPLQELIRRPGGTYELRFAGSASSKPVIADIVVLATPWTTLRSVDLSGAGFPAYRLQAIRELGMGTDVKLLLQYDRRPWKFHVLGKPWSGVVNHSDPNYDTWESSTDEKGAAGLITVYAGGSGSEAFISNTPHEPAPPALASKVVGQIDQVVPGTGTHFNGKAWLDYWTGDPWTLGSYAAYRPGQMTRYWGYAGIPEDNVHFAGEHTSTYSQGYLNGGCESGQRTAIEVLQKLGIPVPRAIARLPYSYVPGERIGSFVA
jgi:monoamine oxidase